jgi:hypothetical protein
MGGGVLALMFAACGGGVEQPREDGGVEAASPGAPEGAASFTDASVAKDAPSPGDASVSDAGLAEDASNPNEEDGGWCKQPCDPKGECTQYGNPCLVCWPTAPCCVPYVGCAKPLDPRTSALLRAQ